MNDPQSASNPYAPPAAIVEDDYQGEGDGGNFVPGGRKRDAGQGANWIGDAWRMFAQQPVAWILMSLLAFGIFIVLSLIPLVNFFAGLLMPFFVGGTMIACANQRASGELRVGDLLAAFNRHTGPLLVLGLISFGFGILMMLIMAGFFGFSMFAAMIGGGHPTLSAMPDLGAIFLGFVIVFVLGMLFYAALWFAPALIVLNGVEPIAALRQSFGAWMRNILPSLVYGLLLFVLMIVATIPIGLGWLVLGPVMAASVYTSYRDIFIAE